MSDFEILKDLNLLYVEDNLDIRNELEKILKRFFKSVHTAENGKEGLDLFYNINPDMIVTDIRMPVMDGLEFSRGVRSINKEVPIIITSAHNESEYLIQAIDLGIDRYVVKPVDLDILLDAMTHCARMAFFQKEQKTNKRQTEFILDMNPEFIILMNGELIEYVNRSFLRFLQLETLDDFFNSDKPVEHCMVDKENTQCLHKEQWTNREFLTSKDSKVICLCPPQKGEEEKRVFTINSEEIPGTSKRIVTLKEN